LHNLYCIITLLITFNGSITMKTMSISLQENLYERLKHSVPSKKISNFVSYAISAELERKDQELTLAYEEVEKNDARQELLHEWDLIDEQHDK